MAGSSSFILCLMEMALGRRFLLVWVFLRDPEGLEEKPDPTLLPDGGREEGDGVGGP